MAIVTATESEIGLLTTEDLLTIPEDDVVRELIRGELWERPMTTRNYRHSRSIVRISHVFIDWLQSQPMPRGDLVAGEARIRIRRNPDTTVGMDVAYLGPDLASETADGAKFIDGPPVLAIEILSPSDTYGDLVEKIQEYLDAGILIVWVVDPAFRTVTVYRPDALPRLFNAEQEIDAEPHLPGFRVLVGRFFAR